MTREEENREKEITIAAESEYFITKAEEFAWIHGAEWADQNPRKGLWDAEKVIDWLSSWFTDDICQCCLPITKAAREDFFNNLRKAMEE